MPQNLDLLDETPSQTAGPYVHIGCLPTAAGLPEIYHARVGHTPISEGVQGQRISISGHLFDGTGWALRDAIFETWQADANGVYPGLPGADPALSGFCRFAADPETGRFELHTVKPGAVSDRAGRLMAPHISFWIAARGLNMGLQTRLYFPEDDLMSDPLLSRIEHRPRVDSLTAKTVGADAYEFDIHLQGPKETVFLDL